MWIWVKLNFKIFNNNYTNFINNIKVVMNAKNLQIIIALLVIKVLH